MARGVSVEELKRRVALDPFVTAGMVSAEVIEIPPSRQDERLQFLKG